MRNLLVVSVLLVGCGGAPFTVAEGVPDPTPVEDSSPDAPEPAQDSLALPGVPEGGSPEPDAPTDLPEATAAVDAGPSLCAGTCIPARGGTVTCAGTCTGTCYGACSGVNTGGLCAGVCVGQCNAACQVQPQTSIPCSGTCS